MVRKLIMPWWIQIVFVVVIAIVSGLMFLVASNIEESTVRAENVACEVQSIDSKAKPIMELRCDDIGGEINDASFIVSYLQNPGPFACKLYNAKNKTTCALIEKKE